MVTCITVIKCGDFEEVRQRYEAKLQQLFQEISVTDIFDILLEIGLL